MGKVKFNITMSTDGYIAGPNQGLSEPLGVGGEQLHDWAVGLKFFKDMHGDPSDGKTGVDNDILVETFDNVGAVIMGRKMFGGGPGPWKGDEWKGWWGDNPPYHTPVYVLTHHPREPLVMEGGTTFYFVTDGIESALKQAKEAAGDKNISIPGGARAAQQYIAAGLVDEMELHVVPQLLGGGERLFENVLPSVKLDLVRTVIGDNVTHLKYNVSK
jgi:dihydrofolate reductase